MKALQHHHLVEKKRTTGSSIWTLKGSPLVETLFDKQLLQSKTKKYYLLCSFYIYIFFELLTHEHTTILSMLQSILGK